MSDDSQLDMLDLLAHERIEPDQWWRDGAWRALQVCVATDEVFSADTLRDDPFNLPEPRHPSQWGALFSAARAAGLIRPVGYATSATPSRHKGVLRLWRGGPPRAVLE